MGAGGPAQSPGTTHRGAQIRTGDLSDPNGARYQAAPHPERHRVPSRLTIGAHASHLARYVDFTGNKEEQ